MLGFSFYAFVVEVVPIFYVYSTNKAVLAFTYSAYALGKKAKTEPAE